MTDAIQEVKNLLSKLVVRNDGEVYFGSNRDYKAEYDSTDDEVTVTHVASGNSFAFRDGAFRREAIDLTAASLSPSTDDVFATHDGSGTPGAGLYRSDSANSQWVKVEDNTVTVAY